MTITLNHADIFSSESSVDSFGERVTGLDDAMQRAQDYASEQDLVILWESIAETGARGYVMPSGIHGCLHDQERVGVWVGEQAPHSIIAWVNEPNRVR